MGTSKSSSGSPGKGPMVPPWTPAPPPGQDPAPADAAGGDDGQNDGDPQNPNADQPADAQQDIPVAPPGRFAGARTSLGRFAGSGSQSDMKKGLGQYVRKGWSGSSTATRRMGGTITAAGSLYGAFSALANGQTVPGSTADAAILNGRSADEIVSAVVEAVRPIDGTQDTEATRDAMKAAASEVLDKNPQADLLNLSEADRLLMVEVFLAEDIFNRVILDVGQHIQSKAASYSAAATRQQEIKNYIKQTVAAKFRGLQKAGEKLSAKKIEVISRQCVKATFEVFEGDAE